MCESHPFEICRERTPQLDVGCTGRIQKLARHVQRPFSFACKDAWYLRDCFPGHAVWARRVLFLRFRSLG